MTDGLPYIATTICNRAFISFCLYPSSLPLVYVLFATLCIIPRFVWDCVVDGWLNDWVGVLVFRSVFAHHLPLSEQWANIVWLHDILTMQWLLLHLRYDVALLMHCNNLMAVAAAAACGNVQHTRVLWKKCCSEMSVIKAVLKSLFNNYNNNNMATQITSTSAAMATATLHNNHLRCVIIEELLLFDYCCHTDSGVAHLSLV